MKIVIGVVSFVLGGLITFFVMAETIVFFGPHKDLGMAGIAFVPLILLGMLVGSSLFSYGSIKAFNKLVLKRTK